MHFYQLSSVIIFTLLCLSYNLAETTSLTCYTTETNTMECNEDVKTCFTKIDSDKIIRGCTSANLSCDEPNCRTCTTDKCNAHKICKTCNATDPDCAQTDASDDKYNTICDENSVCIKKVEENKTISRGCASEQEKTECDGHNKTCTTCTDDKCNKGIFPDGRIQCHQCDDVECNIISTATAKPCLLYAEDDSCYTHGLNDTNMKRGCYSDIESKCNETNTEVPCDSCKQNGCNKYAYSRKQSLTCLQCADNSACVLHQDSKNAKECTNEILYYQEEFCYLQFKDGVVHRGCYNERSEDLGNCTDPSSKCSKCSNGNGCNNEEVQFTCIRCRSDVHPECHSEAEKLSGQQCSNTTDAANSGCYHGVWNDVVIRGCMNDADIRMKYQCTNDQDHTCEQCNGIDCNKKATNDATGELRFSVLMISLLLIIGCLLR